MTWYRPAIFAVCSWVRKESGGRVCDRLCLKMDGREGSEVKLAHDGCFYSEDGRWRMGDGCHRGVGLMGQAETGPLAGMI